MRFLLERNGLGWVQETLAEWAAEAPAWVGAASQSEHGRSPGKGMVLTGGRGGKRVGRSLSGEAEAQRAPRTRRGSHTETRHHMGAKVVWRSHKRILESVVLMTCPEMKGLLMRW